MNHYNTIFHTSNRQVETSSSSSSENCQSLHPNKTRCRIKSSYFPHEDDEATSAVGDAQNAKGNSSNDDDDDEDEQTKFLTFPTFRSVVTNGSSSSSSNINNNAADKQLHPIPITTTPRPPIDTLLSNIPTSINNSNVFDGRSPPLPTALHELLGLSQAIHTMSQKSSPLQGAKETNTILSTPACYPTTIDKSHNSTASCPIIEDSTNTTAPCYDKATLMDADSKDPRQHVCSGKYDESFSSTLYMPPIITSQIT